MPIDAFVFDAYGTLFDVHSVMQRCESWWPGKGAALSQAWRAKQLEYTWQRSLMQRYQPFSAVTRDALAWACESLGLALDEKKAQSLMDEYLRLEHISGRAGSAGQTKKESGKPFTEAGDPFQRLCGHAFASGFTQQALF